jgi:hypothetical protein
MPAPALPRQLPRALPSWLPNLASFQAGWWAVVLGAAAWQPGLGIGLVALLLAWHLSRVRPFLKEAALIGLAALLGLAFESLLQASGWVAYVGGGGGHLAPLWMAALWANFATTLNVSLRPLQGRPWLAAGLGALGGPAAYWGGAQLGAMTFHDLGAGLAALAVAWALLTPLLLALAVRLDGGARP